MVHYDGTSMMGPVRGRQEKLLGILGHRNRAALGSVFDVCTEVIPSEDIFSGRKQAQMQANRKECVYI